MHCCALVGQLAAPVGDVIVGQVRQVTTEGVRLHQIGTGLEVGAVDLTQDVGSGVVEDLITAFEAEEVIFHVEVKGLQLGTHGAIADEHVVAESVKECGGGSCIRH